MGPEAAWQKMFFGTSDGLGPGLSKPSRSERRRLRGRYRRRLGGSQGGYRRGGGLGGRRREGAGGRRSVGPSGRRRGGLSEGGNDIRRSSSWMV